jgi:hypothetical protein
VFFTSAHGPKKKKIWKTYTLQKHQTKKKNITKDIDQWMPTLGIN